MSFTCNPLQAPPMIQLSKTFDLGSDSDRSVASPSPHQEDASTMMLYKTPHVVPRKLHLSPSFMCQPRYSYPKEPENHSFGFAPLLPECLSDDETSALPGAMKLGMKVLPRFTELATDILPMKAFCFTPIADAISSDEEDYKEEDMDDGNESDCSSTASVEDEESDAVASLPNLSEMRLQRAVRRKTLPKKKAFAGKPASPQRPPLRVPVTARRNSLGATAA